MIQSHLQYCKDSIQLVFSEGDVGRDLPQHMDGLQPHLLDFIIKHVHQEVKTFFSKAGWRLGEGTERLYRSDTHLCVKRSQMNKQAVVQNAKNVLKNNGCVLKYIPYISSSSPWTNAPQAPESMRFTPVVSTFSLGASSAHRRPDENSPEAYSSFARSWAVRFLYDRMRTPFLKYFLSVHLLHVFHHLFCVNTLRSDISFLSKVCSRKWGLTWCIEPWERTKQLDGQVIRN